MNKQWSILKISVISFLFLSDTVSFGMYCNHKGTLAVPCKKELITSLYFYPLVRRLKNQRLFLKNTPEFEDRISVMPKELCYDIVALLAHIDRNNMQRTSKYWKALGSKRVPNVYNIVRSQFFNPNFRDYTFLSYCAKYDKVDDVFEKINVVNPNLSTSFFSNRERILLSYFKKADNKEAIIEELKVENYNWASYKWLSNFDYCCPDGPREYRSFGDVLLWNEDFCETRPTELEMACYSGNINKLKDMLAVYDDTKKSFDYNSELMSAVAIAIDKNDLDCLDLFVSLLKKTRSYGPILYSYSCLLEIAFQANKKEAFEFLSDQFPIKPLKYFILPYKDYVELKTALLSDDKKNVYLVLEGLGYNKESYENDNKYHNILSYLISTFCYNAYAVNCIVHLAYIVERINAKRKEQGWEVSGEIFTRQEKDLNICIKKPLLQALKDNNLDRLKILLGKLEKIQFHFNKQQRCSGENSLFSLHVELLQKARQLNNKEAFFLLSCLRLTVNKSDRNDEYVMMSLYNKYFEKINYEINLMEAKQSTSLKDNAYAYVTELV